ncbi:MAG: hypothetical protein FD147_1345 [Chloroflexi bacterium]|nr:MAG: hypothetical protein FD147_1345 [Chloroflexota bacterium]MBA4376636.1 hypothetical protein [Anaerolinea sp.]
MGIAKFDWRNMRPAHKLHRFLYTIGLGSVVGHLVLLLTTTGRKSGHKRITPLQYEIIDDKYYLGAARGLKSDWVRNIEADHHVEVRVKNRCFRGLAEIVTDQKQIADFLEVRLSRHPFMIGLIMEKAHNLPRHPSRQQLEELAAKEVVIVITPAGG